MSKKLLSEIIRETIGAYGGRSDPVASAWADEAELLESKIVLLKDRVIFDQAQRAADGQNDYGLAAYILRDLKTTKDADLFDLCHSLHQETASAGDWRGLRDLWEKAWREALFHKREIID